MEQVGAGEGRRENLHLHCVFLTIMVASQGLVETILISKKEKLPGYFSFQQEPKEALSSRRLE